MKYNEDYILGGDTMDAYLIILSGQGDTSIKIIDEEIWTWLMSDREVDDHGHDINVPQAVIDRMWEEDQGPYGGEFDSKDDVKIYLSKNSHINDRALAIAGIYGSYNPKKAINWCVDNKVKIKNYYEGYIY